MPDEDIATAIKTVTISDMGDLLKMTPRQLSGQASLILSGEEGLLDEACERDIIRALYIPRNLNEPLIYRVPKTYTYLKSRSLRDHYRCVECERPRSYSSGQRCKYCYTLAVRLKFYDGAEGAELLDYQARGIVMPDTEWWSDTDIPATPKRIAQIEWNPKALAR